MTKDLSFLEHKDDDSEELHDQKAYWQMVMSLREQERQYLLQEERVKDEERYLQRMIDCNKQDDETAADYAQQAREYVAQYEQDGQTEPLELAEQMAELARNTKQSRFTIGEIRKQRERIQWERTKLSRMTKPSTEPEQS